MAKKKNILLTHGSLHVPLDQMMSIDIEGAPTLVKQVSIYDFNHELLYNKTATASKELPQWEITKIQRILNRARVLVGHSLDSDLMALRRRGVYLYNDTRCLDTYCTMMEMKQEGLLDGRYSGATLKETALYFHIRANDYHTSHTDALATAVVLQEMMKLGDGMVVEIAPNIIQIPRPPFGMEPDWEKEERGDMMHQGKAIGPKADSRIYKTGDFYECVIAGGQGPTFVRMTQEEYDLFQRIRELRPDYTVRLYSETILTPSIVARLAALEEAEKAAEAAPVAVEPLEEPSEEIEESPVPVEEEIIETPDAEISGEVPEDLAGDAAEKEGERPAEIEEAAAPDVEETEAAEAAQEESPSEEAAAEEIEEASSEEIPLAIEPEVLTEETAEMPEEADDDSPAESDEKSAREEEISAVETTEVSAEEAGTQKEWISCEEATLPEELPPLPEEMPEEIADAAVGGASEPLFEEAIWNLPEDFPSAISAKEAEEQETQKTQEPLVLEEEDAFSMNLFFEPAEESK